MDVPTEPWKQVHKEWCRRWRGGGSPFPGEVREGTQLRTEDEVRLRVHEKTGWFFHLLAVRAQVSCRSPGLGFSICQFRGLSGLVWLRSIVALWKTPRHNAWAHYNIFPGYTQITTKATLSGAAHNGVSPDFKHLPGSIDHDFFLWPLRWWTESPSLLFPVLVTVAKQWARSNERKGFNQGVVWGCAFHPGREGTVQGQEAASHSVLAARKLSVNKKGGQIIRSQGPPPSYPLPLLWRFHNLTKQHHLLGTSFQTRGPMRDIFTFWRLCKGVKKECGRLDDV